MHGILHQRHAAKDRSLVKNHPGQIGQRRLIAQFQRLGVIDGCAGVFPKTNHQHLGQATPHHTLKIGVRLDPVDHQHTIRSSGFPTPKHLATGSRPAQRLHFHRSSKRHSHCFLRDAIPREQRQLPFRSRATVATHCRNYKWLRSSVFQLTNDQRNNLCQVGDPSAPYPQGDAHSRF